MNDDIRQQAIVNCAIACEASLRSATWAENTANKLYDPTFAGEMRDSAAHWSKSAFEWATLA